MIIVYPLITSKRVNPNVLPGICKAVEKYLIVYKQDELFDKIKKNMRQSGRIRSVRGRITLEHLDVVGEAKGKKRSGGPSGGGTHIPTGQTGTADPNLPVPVAPVPTVAGASPPSVPPPPPGGTVRTVPGTGGQPPRQQPGRQPPAPPEDPGAIETVRVQTPPRESLSVEPTWIQMSTPEGTEILGIKVVPFVIDSDASLLKLMENDRYRKKMSVMIQIHVRRITKLMFRIADAVWRKTVGLFAFTGFVGKQITGGTISGNWKKDIVLGLTSFKSNMFILLNKIDLKQDDFLRDAGGINKLFKLGWKSFVIADDVHKSASFCMEEFKGMCSIVNYNFLYSFDRTAHQAYETIEDVKRSSGPLFRRKGRMNKMLKDDLANEKIFEYSKSNLVLEGLAGEMPAKIRSSVKKLKDEPSKLKSIQKQLDSAYKSKNLKKIQSIAQKATGGAKMSLVEAKTILSKMDKNFMKNFELSKKVFANSLPGIPTKLNEVGAAIVAASVIGNKNADKELKNSLRSVVAATRKSASSDSEWDKEVVYAFIFAIFAIAIATAGGLGLAYWVVAPFLSALGVAVTWVMWALIALILSIAFAGVFTSVKGAT